MRSVPGFTDAARTFVLRYTVHGGLRVYSDNNQISWKAIYADDRGALLAGKVGRGE